MSLNQWSGYEAKPATDPLSQWSEYEARTQHDLEEQQQPPRKPQKISSKRKKTPKVGTPSFSANRSCAHIFFIMYSFIAGITAILLGMVQVIGFDVQGWRQDLQFENDLNFDNYQNLPSDIKQDANKELGYVITVFIIFMSALALLTEIGWCNCIINSKLFAWWVTRGLLYIFMGFLSLKQLHDGAKKTDDAIFLQEGVDETLFIQGVSVTFMGIGAGYTIMGLLCGQVVLNRIRLDYRARRYGYKTSNKNNNESPDTPTDLVLDDDKEFT